MESADNRNSQKPKGLGRARVRNGVVTMGSVSFDPTSFATMVLQKAIQTQGSSLLELLDVMKNTEKVHSAPLSGFITPSHVDLYA